MPVNLGSQKFWERAQVLLSKNVTLIQIEETVTTSKHDEESLVIIRFTESSVFKDD